MLIFNLFFFLVGEVVKCILWCGFKRNQFASYFKRNGWKLQWSYNSGMVKLYSQIPPNLALN